MFSKPVTYSDDNLFDIPDVGRQTIHNLIGWSLSILLGRLNISSPVADSLADIKCLLNQKYGFLENEPAQVEIIQTLAERFS